MVDSIGKTLDRALQVFSQREEGMWWRGGLFVGFCGEVYIQSSRDLEPNMPEFRIAKRLLSPLRYIVTDLDNIETLLDRLTWQHQLWKSGHLSLDRWMSYAKADVNMFHVELRSVYDYLAQVFSALANPSGQVPESFNDLVAWVSKHSARADKILSPSLTRLLVDQPYFALLRNVRDSLVHFGDESLVFPDKSAILFLLIKSRATGIQVPQAMFNENALYFELYAGFLYGYLLAFLEDCADAFFAKLGLQPPGDSGRFEGIGVSVARDWIYRARASISGLEHDETGGESQ